MKFHKFKIAMSNYLRGKHIKGIMLFHIIMVHGSITEAINQLLTVRGVLLVSPDVF